MPSLQIGVPAGVGPFALDADRCASLVLENNGESCVQFGHDVYEALALGAKRGINMAIVCGPGIGKSMLFESMDEASRSELGRHPCPWRPDALTSLVAVVALVALFLYEGEYQFQQAVLDSGL